MQDRTSVSSERRADVLVMEVSMKTVVGVFNDADQARQTFHELVGSGFARGEISVLTNVAGNETIGLDLEATDAADTGPIAGRGPLIEAMRAGGSDRALVDSLRSSGFSSQLADHYARALKLGETIESIVVEDKDADRAVAIMSHYAVPLEREPETEGAAAGAAAAGATTAATEGAAEAAAEGATAKEEVARRLQTDGRSHFDRDVRDDEAKIPILREEMHVGKREVERARVHVSVRAAEHPVAENVSLREERIVVERRPINRLPTSQEARFDDAELDIAEYGEEPVVSKDTKVVEEIIVKKRLEARDEIIRDKLRTTQVDFRENRFDPESYRKHFDSLGAKGKFEEQLPAYELGHQLRAPGGKWEDVEAKARATWEAKRPGTWDKVKDQVRHAWSKGT